MSAASYESPGNFTASKLLVKEYQPDLYKQIDKIMLPGDWLARLTVKLTQRFQAFEGILWIFKRGTCVILLDHYGFNKEILPACVPTFGIQGELTDEASADLGLLQERLYPTEAEISQIMRFH